MVSIVTVNGTQNLKSFVNIIRSLVFVKMSAFGGNVSVDVLGSCDKNLRIFPEQSRESVGYIFLGRNFTRSCERGTGPRRALFVGER